MPKVAREVVIGQIAKALIESELSVRDGLDALHIVIANLCKDCGIDTAVFYGARFVFTCNTREQAHELIDTICNVRSEVTIQTNITTLESLCDALQKKIEEADAKKDKKF